MIKINQTKMSWRYLTRILLLKYPSSLHTIQVVLNIKLIMAMELLLIGPFKSFISQLPEPERLASIKG